MRFLLFIVLFWSESLFGQSLVALMEKTDFSPTSSFSTSGNAPAISYTPFDLEGGIIFVEARLNGERAFFILDTGAPGLVLNALAKEGGETSAINGIIGETKISKVKIATFSWAGQDYQEVSATAMDLSAFETMTGRKIQGLIGHDFFKDRELFIDFANQLIRLSKPGNPISGKREPMERIRFNQMDHLPIIKLKINGKTGYFGLDTGSEINILHKRWKKKMAIQPLKRKNILGLDGKAQKVETMRVESIRAGESRVEDMDFYLVDLSKLEEGQDMRLDGILGFPFFNSGKMSIDFEQQQLCIWE